MLADLCQKRVEVAVSCCDDILPLGALIVQSAVLGHAHLGYRESCFALWEVHTGWWLLIADFIVYSLRYRIDLVFS